MITSEKKYQIDKHISIKKIIPTSLIDWEGMIVSTLYVSGCNFRCPFCYNVDLVANTQRFSIINEDGIFKFLKDRKKFIDGVCLSGGEPTIYDDLPEFLIRVKKTGMKIKLDTNGSNPDSLDIIFRLELVDFVSMDIKTRLQPEEYKRVAGTKDGEIIFKIKKSIDLIRNSGVDYEFRTTVVPIYHNDRVIEDIAKDIEGAELYVLQNFVSTEDLLDHHLAIINPYSIQKMEDLKAKAGYYVKKCKTR